MAREELIESAVSFLQDPSVGNSPLETRRQFLASKNLTPDEIRIALARASGSAPLPTRAPDDPQATASFTNPRGFPPDYGYGPWAPPPLEYRRDWRDWFVAATVGAGISYGLFSAAKRWVLPLISPPTSPQLAADKESIDASFNRAFALLEQLQTDTTALQSAERERTERLDKALTDFETTIRDLKESARRREDDARRLREEMREVRDAVPKALDGWKREGDERLREVGTELRGLKTLVSHRVGPAGANASATRIDGSPPAKDPGPGVLGRYVTSSGGGAGGGGLRSFASATREGDRTDENTAPPAFGKHWTAAERSIPSWQLAAANGSKGASGVSGSSDGGSTKAEEKADSTPDANAVS